MIKYSALSAFAIVLATTFSAAHAAGGKVDHSKMNHGEMKATQSNTQAKAKGVINSVDANGGKINVTHEPVPALGWPKMTMDLKVTRRVDLTKLKTGTPVTLTLKQGRDKQFRVIAVEAN